LSRDGRPPGGSGAGTRLAAYRILADVRAGAYADRASVQRLTGLDDRDRALGLELAFGAIRLRARLDAELARLVDRRLSKLDPALLDWLRLGLYQIRQTRIPEHAAVHATVDGARYELGRGAGGLVNAVLRRAAREGLRQEAFPAREQRPVEWLATWGSHPEWLVRRWLDRWPLADVERLVENDNRPPPVTLRLLGADDPAPRLTDNGAGIELERLEGTSRMVRLVAGEPVRALDAWRAVAQDPAASAVVDFVGGSIEGPVLDACAAPGGKAAALADLAPSATPFVAADASPERIRKAVSTLRRTGSNVRVLVMDARRPAIRSARTLILDSPCSGTGVLRRRPDARWRLSESRLASLLVLQTELLDACADVVEAGGLLVYSTCSLEAEENEEQVEAFLARRPEFSREPPGSLTGLAAASVTDRGDLEILPFRSGTDGAFASRLRKGGKE
jgi:16S rRNA (cytosine967-C5)-methyltransferase